MAVGLRLSVLLLSLLLALSNAFAGSPEEMIKDIFARAGKENLLMNTESKLIVESHVDFKVMSTSMLGNDFAKLSASDFKWFEETIKDIITRSVYPSAPKFLDNVKITFKKTEINGENGKVASIVSKKGERTSVDYIVKKVGEDWKVVDVAIDDESWVKTINEKVHKTMSEKGMKGLKDLLSKRLNELKKSATKKAE